MITKIKRKDVGKIVGPLNEYIQDDMLYYVIDQAADKLRAIYILFGWFHMTKDMQQADDVISELVMGCAETLRDNPKKESTSCSTAGVTVSMYGDEEDMINIEVSFGLIH